MDRLSGALRSIACLAAAASLAFACGDTTEKTRTLAVLGAFPAEMAAVLDRATIEETKTIDGHTFRIGTFGGAHVVIAMTGIGLVNAANTTRLLLDNFDVAGVVVSAVAGTPLFDGDVTVPAYWQLDDGSRYPATTSWLDDAKGVARGGGIALEHCAIIPEGAPIPNVAPGTQVCFADLPRVVVGGTGTSSDPFNNRAFPCTPGGTDVSACDTGDVKPFSGVSVGESLTAPLVEIADLEQQVAYDEETAAIARETGARGVPFIAFRAASDGGPDPLNLTGFVEFYGYYRLAAHNAAVAAEACIAKLR